MSRRQHWRSWIPIMPAVAAIILAGLLTLDSQSAKSQDPALPTRSPHRIFDRIVVIVLENTKRTEALQQPYLRHLTAIGALFTDFHAVGHPSYPNYLAMAAGTTFDIRDNEPRNLDATNLADLLESSGVRWKVYAENLPGRCFTGNESPDGLYVRKHEPFISFQSIQTNQARCERILNADQFRDDLAKNALPEYSLYVPNLRNDGHDMPLLDPRAWGQTLLGRNAGLVNADTWLKGFLSPLLQNPDFTRGTLVVVTFDESNAGGGNQVYTVFVGPMVRPGVTNGKRYDHYSLLRTIQDNYGVGSLGREDATATPICCVWKD